MKFNIVVILVLLLSVPLSLAQSAGGKLPKGKPLPSKVKQPILPPLDKVESQNKSKVKYFQCKDIQLNPPGGESFFSPDSSYFFLLSKQDINQGDFYQHTLHKLNLANYKLASVLSINLAKSSELIPHGHPLDGVSIFSIEEGDHDCHQGYGKVLTISLIKRTESEQPNKESPIGTPLPRGHYRVIPTTTGRSFVDLIKRKVLQIDMETFQNRVSFEYSENHIPLFYNLQTKRLMAFEVAGTEKRLLNLRPFLQKRPVDFLMTKPNDKLLMSQGRVALVNLHQNSKTIDIHELKNWTNIPYNKSYSVNLKGDYNWSQLRFEANFSKHLLGIVNTGGPVDQRWQKAELYDYEKNVLVADFMVQKDHFIYFAGFDPAGMHAIFVIKSQLKALHKYLQIYNFDKRKWFMIQFPK